jgi:hypothetical protein
MLREFMNVLRKSFVFGLLALAVAWPLQPQRADRPQRDRELPADNERTTAAAPTEWAKVYRFFGFGRELPATAMQQTPDGGYIVAGEALDYDVGLDLSHVPVWKLDSQGAVEWSTYLEQDVWMGGFSFARGVAQTPDGGYVVGGHFRYNGYWLIKLSAAGAVEWQKQSRGAGSALALLLARDGGFILAGGLQSQGLWVMKLGSDGEVEWQKAYHEQGLAESAIAIAQTPDGGYIAVGHISTSGSADSDILVLKLDPAGEVEWQRRYSEAGGEWANSVQLLADGSYIIAGARGYDDSYQPLDAFAMKLTSDGNIIWYRAYTGFPIYWGGASEIRQTPDGGFIMGCPSALIKLDAYGDIIWQRTYWSISAVIYLQRIRFGQRRASDTRRRPHLRRRGSWSPWRSRCIQDGQPRHHRGLSSPSRFELHRPHSNDFRKRLVADRHLAIGRFDGRSICHPSGYPHYGNRLPANPL